MGSLDDDPGIRPQRHIFVGSKAPWDEIHDDLPRYEGPAPSAEDDPLATAGANAWPRA